MKIIITKATFVRGEPLSESVEPVELDDTVARALIDAHKAVKAPAGAGESEPVMPSADPPGRKIVEDALAGAGESEPVMPSADPPGREKVEDSPEDAGPKRSILQKITGR